MSHEPKSLQEAILYFSDLNNCIDYLAVRRWPNGVTCPSCGSDKVKFNAKRRVWQCSTHHAKRQFSVKVGTIYEDSPIGLDKWMAATWMLTNCKNGVSSYEIARDLKVTQKTAWFMLHRIRLALQDDFFGSKLGGEVEVDETFIGGKARNMHKNVKARRLASPGRGIGAKTIVLGMVERGGRVRTEIITNRETSTLRQSINKHVALDSLLYSDEYNAYKALKDEYAHQIIDHAEQYVDGRVHTNGIENFWSLLKRGISGTYVSVEPFHLFRYLDEQMFRFNNRKDLNDGDRFSLAVSQIVGKRLTFAELTGKAGKTTVN